MKKNMTKLLAATVATSAIVVPTAGAQAATNVEPGVYFATTGEFFTTAQLDKLSIGKIGSLFSDNQPSNIFIYLNGVGTATLEQANKDGFIKAANANGNIDAPEKIITEGSYKTADGKFITFGKPVSSILGSVTAIDATTIEVTFNNKLASLPTASEFSIPGISVKDTKFKEDTDQKVVVLTTTTQSSQNYTLTYNGQSQTFVGKTNLGSVLLTAEKYEVTIKPSAGVLPPVEITANLANFPEGAEAVIEFTTSFGKVVNVLTTQNGKAVFQLTPLETQKDVTAAVTGRVVEVKNPVTGKTYPEFKNSSVGKINVNFFIEKDTGGELIQTYQMKTAFSDQADRVYLTPDKNLDGKITEALNYQTEKLIAEAKTNTKKEMYRHLHDVLFSQISNAIVQDDVKTTKENLKKAFVDEKTEKDITADDLRNILLKDTVGKDAKTNTDTSRYATAYAPLNTTKKALYDEVKAIPDSELQGILSYYKLLSKFAVLDNIKDTTAPQAPNQIFAVEHIYSEDDLLVLVLPTDRSKADRNYGSDKYNQARDIDAKYLQDNVSHQVVFANDVETDRYEITGDPTFKLEDATSIKLMAVQEGRYKVQPTNATNGSNSTVKELNYCALPYAVDVNENYSDDGSDGGTIPTPGKDPSYTGVVKKEASSYTITNVYRPNAIAQGKLSPDKFGEIRVVFSEAVSLQDDNTDNSILNPENWTIDGVSLDKIATRYGVDYDIRLDSTDAVKQLRDVAVLSFSSTEITGDAKKDRNVSGIEKFLEALNSGNHKLEISKVGDWAGETDSKNIVPTQSLDFKGLSNKTDWGAAINTGTSGSTTVDKVHVSAAPGNAFITRAAGDLADSKKDIIRVQFSEPMKIDGTDSILEKSNYRLDGLELPVNGSSIKIGLDGVNGFEESTCAVTIELPEGYLQGKANDHVLTVSNVTGYEYDGIGNRVSLDKSKLEERIQLAYARQYTVVSTSTKQGDLVINGKPVLADEVVNDYIRSISYTQGTVTAAARVYKDAKGNPINVTNAYNSVSLTDFFTKHLVGGTEPIKGDTVKDLNGAIAYDGLLQTYVVRIPADKVAATPANGDKVFLNLAGQQYELKFDADRNIFTNGAIIAQSKEDVEKATVKVEKAQVVTKTVASVNGLVAYDGLLQTYVVRIPVANVEGATATSKLVLTVGGKSYDLAYDADRKIFTNGAIVAANIDEVKAASFTVK